MGRLCALLLFLITIFALMMGVSMQIGQRQSQPARVQRLHLADCLLPCWNGIRPGVSSASAAKDRINAALPDFESLSSAGSSKFLIWTEYADIDRVVHVVNVTIQNSLVATIGIGTDHTSSEMPTLGEVLAVYGAPTCLEIDDVTDHSNWFYENSGHHFMLQFSVPTLSLASPVNNFVFGVADNATCQTTLALTWHDFRNMGDPFFRTLLGA